MAIVDSRAMRLFQERNSPVVLLWW